MNASRRASNQPIPYLVWLERECGYQHIRLLVDGRWAAVYPLMFTAAILVGKLGDMCGYDDRWCYHSVDAAKRALDLWTGVDEPSGWHRHPATGRRVNELGETEVYA